jgi:beta-glucosidase-like glycosyl hydrolase
LLTSHGVIGCAKHFPGHGDTSVDSHLALPVVDKELGELREVELPPFAAMVKAGDMLFDPSTRVAARVRADGSIAIKDASGSIHKIGAHVQGAEACNGWTFWHVKKGPNLVPIDMLRQQLRAEMAAAA